MHNWVICRVYCSQTIKLTVRSIVHKQLNLSCFGLASFEISKRLLRYYRTEMQRAVPPPPPVPAPLSSPVSHFRHSFSMFVELKILIWFTYLYSICTCHIGQTEMHKSLLSRGKVKTRDARTCIFVLENDTLQAYRLVFTAWVTEWMRGGCCWCHFLLP